MLQSFISGLGVGIGFVIVVAVVITIANIGELAKELEKMNSNMSARGWSLARSTDCRRRRNIAEYAESMYC